MRCWQNQAKNKYCKVLERKPEPYTFTPVSFFLYPPLPQIPLNTFPFLLDKVFRFPLSSLTGLVNVEHDCFLCQHIQGLLWQKAHKSVHSLCLPKSLQHAILYYIQYSTDEHWGLAHPFKERKMWLIFIFLTYLTSNTMDTYWLPYKPVTPDKRVLEDTCTTENE